MLTVCTEYVYHSYLSLDIYRLKTDHLQRLHPLRLVKPSSLIQLYAINLAFLFFLSVTNVTLCSAECNNPTLRSSLYNKHTNLPGCCSFSRKELRPPHYSILSTCPSVFSSFPQVRFKAPGAVHECSSLTWWINEFIRICNKNMSESLGSHLRVSNLEWKRALFASITFLYHIFKECSYF